MTLLKSFVALTASVLFIYSAFADSIKVNNALSLIDINGQQVRIPANTYDATFEQRWNGPAELTVHPRGNGQPITALFDIAPGTLDMPIFDVPAQGSGQRYRIVGTNNTRSVRNGSYSEQRSCTYNDTEYQCRDEYVRPTCRQEYERPTCRTERDRRVCRTEPGRRSCRQERLCDANNRCRTREVCSEGRPREVCTGGHAREVCTGGGYREVCSGGGYRQVCGNRTVTRYGYQQVNYEQILNTTTQEIRLLTAGHRYDDGIFTKSSTDVVNNYIGSSSCR